MLGYGERVTEEWKLARFVGWSSWVASRGNEKYATPKEWLPGLPGDDEGEKVKRKDFDGVFEHLSKTWKVHS